MRVLANLAAGHTTDLVVEPGTAIRIMTRAPLPAGAEAVVRFEETSEGLSTGERVDGQERVWIGTTGGGIAVYDGISWTRYTTSSGLPSNTVNAIAFRV